MLGFARESAEVSDTQPRLFDRIGPTCAWKPWPDALTLPSYVTATGRKWYWMSGQRMPARLRMKPQLSKWLVAPSPSWRSTQRAPITAFDQGFMIEYNVTGSLHATWK